MKSTGSCFFVFLLLNYHVLFGSDTITPLKIGDKVPDIFWNTVVNYNKSSVHLSDFKGKKIILDLWHRWCGTCISSFPYLERMQEKYKGQLVILAITSDRLDDFNAAKGRSRIIQESKLPFIVNDTLMTSVMRPGFYPFYIWIDDKGILAGTTGWSGITQERVESFIQRNEIGIDLGTRRREAEAADVDKMYNIKERKREFEGVQYYSSLEREPRKILSPQMRALKYSLPGEGVQILDATLLELYSGAFKTKYRDIITFDSTLKELLYPVDSQDKRRMEKWENSNVYSYQIRFPPESVEKINRERTYLYIQRDLQDYTGIKAKKKQVERKVFVLTADASAKFFLKPDSVAASISERTGNGIFIQNGSMDSFCTILATVLNAGRIEYMPLMNETGIAKAINIDLIFTQNIPFEEVNRLLKPHGLQVKIERRKKEYLVLSR